MVELFDDVKVRPVTSGSSFQTAEAGQAGDGARLPMCRWERHALQISPLGKRVWVTG